MSHDFSEDMDDFDVYHGLEVVGQPANAHFKDEHIDLTLEHERIFGEAVIYKTDLAGEQLQVSYIAIDHYPEPHQFEQGESLLIHTSQADRDADFMDKHERGHYPFIVNRYSHSGEHFSVQGTVSYPSEEFDVAPSGIYVASSENLKLLESGAIDLTELMSRANSSLDSYSDFVNGNAYLVVSETFERDEGFWRQMESENLAVVGIKRAREAVYEVGSPDAIAFDALAPQRRPQAVSPGLSL